MFARAWFSAHPGCSILREHVASTQGSDWLLSKPTFQMTGWGDIPTGSKNKGLNQPKAQEPCTMHPRVIKNGVESRALQANSCNNLKKGYCKLGQVKGDCSGRERVNSHPPPEAVACPCLTARKARCLRNTEYALCNGSKRCVAQPVEC